MIDFICPLVQTIFGNSKGENILTSRLVNGHADIINVVDVIKEIQGSKHVALHLRIIGRIYEDSSLCQDTDAGIHRCHLHGGAFIDSFTGCTASKEKAVGTAGCPVLGLISGSEYS